MQSPRRVTPGFHVGRGLSTAVQQFANFPLFTLILGVLWSFPAACLASQSFTPTTSRLLNIHAVSGLGGAIADLDGDGRSDLAVVSGEGRGTNGARYQIELNLSAHSGPSSFCVTAGDGGLHIIPRDVNGDGDLDLVITSARSLVPVGVWINNGRGAFTPGDTSAYTTLAWDEGLGIASGDPQRIFPVTIPQSSSSWLDFSKRFRFWSELPSQRLRLSHRTSNFSEIAVGQPRTRAPPYFVPRQTS